MADRGIVGRMPRWLGALPVSLALHGLVLLAMLSPRREESLPALMIDLNAMAAHADDSLGRQGMSASRGRQLASASSAESRGTRAERSPRSALTSSVPSSPAPTSRTTASSTPRPTASTLPPAPAESPIRRQDSDEPTKPAAPATPPPAPAMAAAPPPIPAPPERREPMSSGPTALPPDIPPAAGPSGSAGGTNGTAPGLADDASAGVGARNPNGRASGGAAAFGAGRLALAVPGSGEGGNEYSAYLSRLRERLQQGLRYPPSAQRRGISGTVQLEIAIEADGAVSSVALAASSSHESLDRAALEAARALARQPFPADVRPRPLTVRVPVTFKLQ